jgi:photosystem II stability/assembly factor-like uncharacterized protein
LCTEDGGATWQRRLNLLQNKPLALHMWDDVRGICVGNSGTVYRTTDGFRTATSSFNPTYGHLNCVFFLNDTLGWVGTQTGKIYRSTDAGVSWTLMQSGQSTSNYMTAIQFLNPDTGYASCYAGEMLKSTDGGLTWLNVGPFDQLVLMRDLHFYSTQEGVAVGSAGEVIRTTDGGVTWDSIPSSTTYSLNAMAVQGDVIGLWLVGAHDPQHGPGPDLDGDPSGQLRTHERGIDAERLRFAGHQRAHPSDPQRWPELGGFVRGHLRRYCQQDELRE